MSPVTEADKARLDRYLSDLQKVDPAALTRDQQQVRETLSPYDLLVVLGADVLRMSHPTTWTL